MRRLCSHRYLVRGASYTCHLFDITVAIGAEGSTRGTGVAVHLPINFQGLSGCEEKKKENYSAKKEEIQHKPNMMGIGWMEHDSNRIVTWMGTC